MSRGPNVGPKFSQIRALVAVADFGSFGEAALHLELTQPTVSHAISTLEEELGVVLLVRGRHGAQLTPVGEAVAKHAREVLHLLSKMHQTANLHKGLEGGEVRIATFRGAAANLLPPIVAQFRGSHPAISITITEHYDFTYVEQQIRDGKADIGITFLPTGTEFETVKLMSDPFCVLVSSDMARAKELGPLNRPLTWEQLMGLPLITYPKDNSCFANVQGCFREAGFDLKPDFQFRETSTIVSMVAQGLGAAIVPELSAHPIPEGVKVAQLPTPLDRTIGVILLAGSLQPPAVFAFLKALRRQSPETQPLDHDP